MDFETILYETIGHTAVVTLNRPERLNAFDDRMTEELGEVWRVISEDDNAWTIVLTATGRGFCSGADQTVGARRSRDAQTGRPRKRSGPSFLDPRHFLSPKNQHLFKPLIVAVNGICAGGGFYFLLEADIPICSTEATFLEPHTSHGLTAAVEPVGLRWRIPVAWVTRMALMGKHERMGAEQALATGLVTEVVEPERLRDRALEIAETVNRNSPDANHATVETMWRSFDMTRSASLDYALTMTHHNRLSEAEGRASFREKREPNWE